MSSDPLMTGLLIAHGASTLVMAGIIWFVQVVHYPLFAQAGSSAFPAYEHAHAARTTWVVAPPMLIELGTAVALIALAPSVAPTAVAGLALLAIIWVSTFTLQVPCHARLARGFDPEVHRRLVSTNWIRTVAWTARAALVCWVSLASRATVAV